MVSLLWGNCPDTVCIDKLRWIVYFASTVYYAACIILLCSIVVDYSYHMNRADYLLNSSFQYNTVLEKNGNYDDPDDVESIFESLKKLNF